MSSSITNSNRLQASLSDRDSVRVPAEGGFLVEIQAAMR